MYLLGIDIGGTKINIGIITSDGKLLSSKKFFVCDNNNIEELIKENVDNLIKNTGITYCDISSCGVGIPGTVSEDGKKIFKAPNLKLDNEHFAENLEKSLGVPVTMLQDSRAAALGEYKVGAGNGKNSVICITLGTGIGTGIVLDGKNFNGPLGCAGELGHIPVVENGRFCGCGKSGCLEKYAAGKGLDITASELLGEGKTSKDLFKAAENGKTDAINAINTAVELLGMAVVGAINLISPECVLFSGGLSTQTDLFINPLINYIKTHCYAADGKIPTVSVAALGENAPLIGAALAGSKSKAMNSPTLSASIMCADLLNLSSALKEIEKSGIKYLHCDIMDNHFVPNLMLPMEMLNSIKKATTLPFDYHIMAYNPESIIDKLDISETDIVSVHYEATPHIQKVLSYITQKGAKAAVAINPGTPLDVLEDILPDISMLLIMTVNPGFAGQKLIPQTLDKVARARKFLDDKGYSNVIIEVDGNCSFENIPKMHKAGADILVVGTSSVFKKEHTIKEGVLKVFETLK